MRRNFVIFSARLPSIQTVGGGNPRFMPLGIAKKKCRNFFVTLINLARQRLSEKNRNLLIAEIQRLLNGQTHPNIFVLNLQRLMNSAPVKCLGPFLIRALPGLRNSLQSGDFVIGK